MFFQKIHEKIEDESRSCVGKKKFPIFYHKNTVLHK